MQTLPYGEAVIFDMDGTLFRSESILLPAYRRMFDSLKKQGLHSGPTPPEERILGGLGMLLSDIWERVMPEASDEVRREADRLLLEYQMEALKEGLGELYPGVEESLRELHARGRRLFVASNGLERYVKAVAIHFQLDGLFTGMYSAGEYGTRSKVDLVRILMETHKVESGWMVGDRSSDVEAGKRNGLSVVGCAYARFGRDDELDGADTIITDFSMLTRL